MLCRVENVFWYNEYQDKRGNLLYIYRLPALLKASLYNEHRRRLLYNL